MPTYFFWCILVLAEPVAFNNNFISKRRKEIFNYIKILKITEAETLESKNTPILQYWGS
jgi:hypothetical protein